MAADRTQGDVDALIADLGSENAAKRAAAMDTLAEIASPAVASRIYEALTDPDERVRSHAARALVRMGDPRAPEACLRTLDDVPDELHVDMTPSVTALATMGIPVVPRLLDLMLDENEMTRLHAQRALEAILDRLFGFLPGRGFQDAMAPQALKSLWVANGSYDSSAPEELHRASVARWRAWLKGLTGTS